MRCLLIGLLLASASSLSSAVSLTAGLPITAVDHPIRLSAANAAPPRDHSDSLSLSSLSSSSSSTHSHHSSSPSSGSSIVHVHSVPVESHHVLPVSDEMSELERTAAATSLGYLDKLKTERSKVASLSIALMREEAEDKSLQAKLNEVNSIQAREELDAERLMYERQSAELITGYEAWYNKPVDSATATKLYQINESVNELKQERLSVDERAKSLQARLKRVKSREDVLKIELATAKEALLDAQLNYCAALCEDAPNGKCAHNKVCKKKSHVLAAHKAA